MDITHSLYKFYSTKSTQTEQNGVSETTQTDLKTTEIAVQTDLTDQNEWTPENPLKRKLFVTVNEYDPKSLKLEQNDSSTDMELDTENMDSEIDAQMSIKLDSDQNFTNNSIFDITCQPDISNIVPEKQDKKKKLAKAVKKEKKKYAKKATKASKKSTKKGKSKKKVTQADDSDDSIADSECLDYDTRMANRLEESIRRVQNQWRIHEKKYRKDGTNDNDSTEADVETIQEKIKQGRSYGNELKFLSLNLFYSNPNAYKALRQQLNLPTEKTLRRIEVGVTTKLTDTVIGCLKLMLSKMKEEETYCVVCTSIIPLREEIHKIANTNKSIGNHEINEIQSPEPATYCLVVLLRGLYCDWKQPLISCFLKENFNYNEVNKWLDDIIETLLSIGLKIVAYSTTEQEHLLNMAKERNISFEQPYFFVNNHKIYFIFDVIHLMHSFRNLLINNFFRFIDFDGTEMLASWFDIEKLYETDKTRFCKLAPKLTESHIRPNDLEKTRIQYSTQVFSKTVAFGIMSCIEQKHLTNRSFGTVKFVELLNDSFDILNSVESQEDRFKVPFSFKEFQIATLDKMVNILSNMKIITKNYEDITNTIETMRCFEISIRSILSLASDMKHFGYEYLCTRNLNTEQLDVFFESMRKKWGVKTSACLFYAGFRNFFLENVIKKSESHSSCGLDKDLIAVLLKDNNSSKEQPKEDPKDNKEKDFNPFYKYL